MDRSASVHSDHVNYSVSQKKSPYGFLNFFPNGFEFLINSLHTYYKIISTLEYKFLFKYLQLWYTKRDHLAKFYISLQL